MRTPQDRNRAISLSDYHYPHQRHTMTFPLPSRLHIPCKQVADISQLLYTFPTQSSPISTQFPTTVYPAGEGQITMTPLLRVH